MNRFPSVGVEVIKRSIDPAAWTQFQVRLVRDLNDYQKIVAIRAAAFMSEQACPFEEEFDGNDLTATHLIAFEKGEPVGTLRLRWFSGFGKVERVCVLKRRRGTMLVRVMLAHAFELAARKGYGVMIAQIQSRLWPVWSRMLKCTLREDRETLSFSGFDYKEIDISIPDHPNVIRSDEDAYVMIRPEGDWDRPGILEQSANHADVTKAA